MHMNSYSKKIIGERTFAWIVFLLFIGIVTRTIVMGCTYYSTDYCSYEISEWLINYEGGFVRRGIIGQLLYWIEQQQQYDVRIVIMVICIVSSVIISGLTLHIFHKEGWSILLIPTGFAYGYTLFSLWGRKDFLSLLLTFLIFISFKSVILHKRIKLLWWIVFYFLSILQLLIHEASFFYSFPIIALLLFQHYRKQQLTICKSCLACFIRFFPIIIVMSAVCIFKGDLTIAETIWKSWESIFKEYPSDYSSSTIGEGVGALAWEATNTFADHLSSSYMGFYSPSYARIPIVLTNFIATYFIISRVNTINMGLTHKKQMDNVTMSNIAIIQFFALLPMYTFLSCDWGRTIPYWVISSLFFYHIFKDVNYEFPRFITHISRKMQNLISENFVFSSPYTYILLVFLIPIPRIFAPFDFMNTFQWFWIEELSRKISLLLGVMG